MCYQNDLPLCALLPQGRPNCLQGTVSPYLGGSATDCSASAVNLHRMGDLDAALTWRLQRWPSSSG